MLDRRPISRLLAFGFAFVIAGPLSIASAADKTTPITIAEVKRSGPVDFEKEILPIMRRSCLACHNASAKESDLILESPQTMLKGGSEGPSVIAGDGAKSLLLQLAAHQKEPVMPPKGNDVKAKNLTSAELGLLKLWIDQGAKGQVKSATSQITWQPLPAGVNPIYAVAVSADGQFAAAGRANQIFLYHLPSKRELGRLTDPALLKSGIYKNPGVAHLDLVQALEFNPAGNLLASGGYREVKLWRRSENEKKELKGLESAPRAIAVSGDGKVVAVGEENGKIKLFDPASGNVTKTLTNHSAAVSAVRFTADNARLVSGSQDKSVRVWNVADGKAIGMIETAAPVNAVTLAGEDKQIAAGGADNVIRIFDIAAAVEKPTEPAKPVKELSGHKGPVTSLSTLSAGEIVSGSQDGNAMIWSIEKGNSTKTLAHGGPVDAIAVRADGQRVVSVSSNNSAKLWNVADGKSVAELKGDYRARIRVDEMTRGVALAKRNVDSAKKDLDDATKRKTAEEDNAKKSLEAVKKAEEEFKKKEEAAKKPEEEKLAADKELATVTEPKTKAEEAKKVADEALAKATEAAAKAKEAVDKADAAGKPAAEKALADADAAKKTAEENKKKVDEELAKVVAEFNKVDQKTKKAITDGQKAIDERMAADRALKAAQRSVERANESVKKAIDALPTFDAAVKSADDAAKKADAALEAEKKAATDSEKPLKGVAFSSDGTKIATVGDDQMIHTWDSETGAAIDRYAAAGAPVTQVVFLPDGRLFSCAANNSALIWTSGEWKLERTIGDGVNAETFADRVTALDFSPDGKVLATGGGEPSRSGEVKFWNADTGAAISALKEPHSDTVFGLEFSPDGKQVASSGADRFAKIHTVADGKFVRSFEGHTHHVLGVTWRADGRILATCGADMAIKVWDVRTGDQQRTIQGFGKEITSIRFVAEGDTVVASCGDKSVQIKNATSGAAAGSLSGATDYMYSAAPTGDGKFIVGGGQDSVLRVWTAAGQAFATFDAPKPPTTDKVGQN